MRTRKRSWMKPLGDPLAWSPADKCLLVVGIMMTGVALFFLLGRLVPGWLYLPPELHESASGLIDRLTLASATSWSVMLAAGLVLRKRAPENRVFVVITVLHYSLTIAVLVCLSGAFHSPGWILFMGGVVLGVLLFGRRLTMAGVALFAAVFISALIADEYGYLGDLLVITHPPPPESSEWSAWLWRMSISTVVFGGMVLALIIYVISLLHDREARLDKMAKTDGLTGVFNRRHFIELVTGELARSKRYGTPLSVVMIDLDYFKSINDEYGHLIGDRVLIAVADALARSVRDVDVVARYGGEEFVLMLPSTDRTGARELAERCRELVAGLQVETDRGQVEITASMGLASFPQDVDGDVDALLSAADDALYRAKDGGRNRVEQAAS